MPSTTAGHTEPTPTTTTAADPYAPGPCPDARTCTERKLLAGRWPRDNNGVTTIHYRVNPTNAVRPQFSDAQIVAAVRAALQAVDDASPYLLFVYDGTTTAKPSGGNNVVGFGPLAPVFPGSTSHTPSIDGPTYTGFSITINEATTFSLRECDPRHGQPCTDDDNYAKDLQGLLTHEAEHVVGVDHPPDGPAAYEQTVCNCGSPNGRSTRTLAKGDVIAVREVTGTPRDTPMPIIYWP